MLGKVGFNLGCDSPSRSPRTPPPDTAEFHLGPNFPSPVRAAQRPRLRRIVQNPAPGPAHGTAEFHLGPSFAPSSSRAAPSPSRESFRCDDQCAPSHRGDLRGVFAMAPAGKGRPSLAWAAEAKAKSRRDSGTTRKLGPSGSSAVPEAVPEGASWGPHGAPSPSRPIRGIRGPSTRNIFIAAARDPPADRVAVRRRRVGLVIFPRETARRTARFVEFSVGESNRLYHPNQRSADFFAGLHFTELRYRGGDLARAETRRVADIRYPQKVPEWEARFRGASRTEAAG